MTTFALKKGSPYIELNKLMKVLGWVGSGGEANQMIELEHVSVNGSVEKQKRKKLVVGDRISFDDYEVVIE